MKRFRYIWLLPLVLALPGCATNYATKSAAEVGAALEVKNSEFDSVAMYAGPPVYSTTRRGLFVDNETVRLAAATDKKSGKAVVFIYVKILYPVDWRFYNSISLKDSSRVEAESVSRSVDACGGMGCLYTEEFSVPINPIKLGVSGEFQFRVNSKNGTENVITLQRSYITGFLQSVRARGLII